MMTEQREPNTINNPKCSVLQKDDNAREMASDHHILLLGLSPAKANADGCAVYIYHIFFVNHLYVYMYIYVCIERDIHTFKKVNGQGLAITNFKKMQACIEYGHI